ncbi:hypothetical protein [Acidovorax sp. 1608163]|uniref:hypothetical protein n=1 Tax=Acidovorax sp. 1608163 TaxID=2478662 RepID=UPI0013CEE07E|nr:hypothetical protein [Acidovorax sp. 1608163]
MSNLSDLFATEKCQKLVTTALPIIEGQGRQCQRIHARKGLNAGAGPTGHAPLCNYRSALGQCGCMGGSPSLERTPKI